MRRSILLALPFVLSCCLPAAAQQTSNTAAAFDNWVLGCASRSGKDGKMARACEIRSTLVVHDRQSKQQGVAAVVAVGRLSVDKPDMQFVVQLPIHALVNVPARITDKDGKPVLELPFVACQSGGICSASAAVNDIQLSALKKVDLNFYVTYRNQAGQDLKIEGSINGFNRALEAMMRER